MKQIGHSPLPLLSLFLSSFLKRRLANSFRKRRSYIWVYYYYYFLMIANAIDPDTWLGIERSKWLEGESRPLSRVLLKTGRRRRGILGSSEICALARAWFMCQSTPKFRKYCECEWGCSGWRAWSAHRAACAANPQWSTIEYAARSMPSHVTAEPSRYVNYAANNNAAHPMMIMILIIFEQNITQQPMGATRSRTWTPRMALAHSEGPQMGG